MVDDRTFNRQEPTMHAQEMIASHPTAGGGANGALIACIEACYDCDQACTVCADACLNEPTVKDLVRCIRLDLDCADICAATGRIVSRQSVSDTQRAQRLIAICGEMCRQCAEECERHAARHAHCRVCGE